MFHLRGSVAAALVLSSSIFTGLPVGASPVARAAARSTAMVLQPAVLVPRVAGGARAGLFVHAPAFAQLMLAVVYPGGGVASYQGQTDAHGRYVFSWQVPRTLRQAGEATLDLHARRGALSAEWHGVVAVHPAPLPPLYVQPTAAHFLAGTSVGVFVRTAPQAHLSYRITAAPGRVLAQGTARADATGRAVLTVPERYLPERTVKATAVITVQGPSGVRTSTVHFLLMPRPPLPLSLRLVHPQVHVGEPMTVSVTSAPAATVRLRMVVGGKTILQAGGVTGVTGRWTYTTDLTIALTRARAAHLVVVAAHGIDRATSHLTFLLQPARFGIMDRFASRVDPTPNLARFFTQIPDKVILVSTEGQSLRAYEHGVLVDETYVTTGRRQLPTPHGVFHIMAKYSPFEFISPWAAGSPYYYPPSWVHYAMLFDTGGYFIHDSPWRKVYGPGTNLPHYALDPGEPFGSHGCVNTPSNSMAWLWNWTTVGTIVVVY